MRKIYFIVFYCLVLITPNILSQTAYIVDNRFFVKPSPYYFLQDSIFQNYQYIDTNVLHFQNSLPFYFNGQIGTAQPDYLLQHQSAQIGSRVLSIYYPDVLRKEDINIYRTKGFYAQLDGIAGSKDEQHFKAYFTSPIKQTHQINFYFRRSTNTGFYQFQKSNITNLVMDYHWYNTKKLSMDGRVIFNSIKHQENGGIVNDTLTSTALFIDKSLVPVSLSSAKKSIQSNEAEYNVHYLIQKDSIKALAISLQPFIQQEKYQYVDNKPLSGYYNFVFIDTLQTNDSLHSLKLELPISTTFQYKKNYFQLSYKYQWNKIYLYTDTMMQNHFIDGQSHHFTKWKDVEIKHHYAFNYIFSGTQKENYKLIANAQIKYHQWLLDIGIKGIQQSPTFQQNFWYSNHFIWLNHFKDVQSVQFSSAFNYSSHLQLSYNFFQHKNYIYFLEQYPQQYNKDFFVHQFKVQVHTLFWKHLGISANYYYQYKTADIIALPEHFVKGDIYYQGRWFHQNLLVLTGFQYISSITAFDTYQYTPATGIYSVSYTPMQALPYPHLSFYFSGRIKPVNFFIRIDNILNGIIEKPYYYLPHYMMPDRAFKMGISWMFFD
jgi:hypothetical protein